MIRIFARRGIKKRFRLKQQAIYSLVINDVIDGIWVFPIIWLRMSNPVKRFLQVNVWSVFAAGFHPYPHLVAQLVKLPVEIAGNDKILLQAGTGIDSGG